MARSNGTGKLECWILQLFRPTPTPVQDKGTKNKEYAPHKRDDACYDDESDDHPVLIWIEISTYNSRYR
jgi:hypothetical protein